jgi:hypothetical protein
VEEKRQAGARADAGTGADAGAGVDAGVDAGADAGVDAGAGVHAGAGVDAGAGVGATACRPIVSRGAGRPGATVDVGAWALVVLGPDGGAGSPDLCRPLAQRPEALGLTRGESAALRLRISLAVPDQDMTRVHAAVVALRDDGGSLPTAAQTVANTAMQTLLEPLRSLGGEATAAEVKVEVRCPVSLR